MADRHGKEGWPTLIEFDICETTNLQDNTPERGGCQWSKQISDVDIKRK